jgi:hypothetical protein
MENNAPGTIIRNVNKAINHLNLEEIAQNARSLVENEYTYEKTVERYRIIFSEILGNGKQD